MTYFVQVKDPLRNPMYVAKSGSAPLTYDKANAKHFTELHKAKCIAERLGRTERFFNTSISIVVI